MPERECAVRIFLVGFVSLDLGSRFRNAGDEQHQESHRKDSQRNEQRGSSLRNLGFGCIADERTHQDGDENGRSGVQHTAELDELVAPVTSSAQGVEHGIDHAVEHAHAKTGYECSDKVHPETLNAVPTRHVLQEHSHKADHDRQQGRFLVTDLLEQKSRGDPHDRIRDEVGRITELGGEVRGTELILDDHRHR